ncbi:MAG: hypothetical protein ACOYT8_01365 [Candidatus Dependentiae bacterium]
MKNIVYVILSLICFSPLFSMEKDITKKEILKSLNNRHIPHLKTYFALSNQIPHKSDSNKWLIAKNNNGLYVALLPSSGYEQALDIHHAYVFHSDFAGWWRKTPDELRKKFLEHVEDATKNGFFDLLYKHKITRLEKLMCVHPAYDEWITSTFNQGNTTQLNRYAYQRDDKNRYDNEGGKLVERKYHSANILKFLCYDKNYYQGVLLGLCAKPESSYDCSLVRLIFDYDQINEEEIIPFSRFQERFSDRKLGFYCLMQSKQEPDLCLVVTKERCFELNRAGKEMVTTFLVSLSKRKCLAAFDELVEFDEEANDYFYNPLPMISQKRKLSFKTGDEMVNLVTKKSQKNCPRCIIL